MQLIILFMKKINIILNGENYQIDENINILKLICLLELDPKKIAIEKDFEIITNVDYDKIILNENCKIEIVHFIGGG
jgi:thiamine biosynthesis protein ThiS